MTRLGLILNLRRLEGEGRPHNSTVSLAKHDGFDATVQIALRGATG